MSTTPSSTVAVTDDLNTNDAVIGIPLAVGEFDPIEYFKVKFAVYPTPMPIEPPIYRVPATVLSATGHTIASFILTSGQTRTVNIPASMPGAPTGTMVFGLNRDTASLTCKYDLATSGVIHPGTKKGTYTFLYTP